MIPKIPAALLALAVIFCSNLCAQQIIVCDGDGGLYSIDPNTPCSPVPLPVSSCGEGFFSIALYKDTLYANDPRQHLFRVILGDTAACVQLPLAGPMNTNVLTVDAQGNLLWVDYFGDLVRYNPHTYVADTLGVVQYSPSGDLTFYQGNLIMSDESSRLVNIDIQNPGQSSVLMETPGYLVYGLANLDTTCAQHTVYAFTGSNTATVSDVLEIDMSTGAIQRVCTLPFAVYDAASTYEYGGYGLTDNIFPATDTTLCTGASLLLNAQVPGGAYVWNDGSTASTETVDSTGKYWVTVSAWGCVASDTLECTVIGPPSLSLPRDTLACVGEKVLLNAQSPEAAYAWQDGSRGSQLTVTEAGLYIVHVSTICGSVTDSTSLAFTNCSCRFSVPSAFTPNHDGHNDLFLPRYTCTPSDHVLHYLLRIYNRWGQAIFISGDPSAGWDGTYKGQLAPVGAYAWEIEYQDETGKAFHQDGTVMLMR